MEDYNHSVDAFSFRDITINTELFWDNSRLFVD